MSGDKPNTINQTPIVEEQEVLGGVKKEDVLRKKLIEEAKKIIESKKLKGDVLVADEYDEFIKGIEKESLTLEQSTEVDKNLEKRLGQEELKEFKSNIEAISKIKKYPNSEEFEKFVNDNISDNKQEKFYSKINKTKNLDNILIYLFGEAILPTNKAEFRNLYGNNFKIIKDFKNIEKISEELLNNPDIKIENIDDILKRINKIENVLKGSKLRKIEEIKEKFKKVKITEVKEETTEVEKNNIIKEVTKKDKEAREEELIKNIIPKTKDYLYNGALSGIKKNTKDLINDFDENNFNSKEMMKVVSEIIAVLKKGNGKNLKKFIEEEAEKGEDAYNKAVNFIKSFGDSSLNVYLTKIDDYPRILTGETPKFPKNIDDFTKKQLMDSLGVDDMSEITQNGDIFTVGDKQIIFEDGEAVLYNLSENGYRMESDVAEMGDEYRELKKFKDKISFVKEEYKRIGDELNGLYLEKNDFIAKAKRGELSITQKEFYNKISEFDNKINEKLNYLKVLEKKAKEITSNYQDFLENNKFKLDEELETKQKETLKFLSKIGFDLVPQYITKQLIENINFAPQTYGFDAKIDLENGDLGIRGFGDDYMSPEYKDEFMKIFIKAIGNPQMDGKNIFNENNINNGANVIDSSKLDLYLNTNGYKGFGAFEKMKANLLDSKQEKNPN